MAVERYEIGYGVLPLPTTSTTSTTTGSAVPFSPAEQEMLLHCSSGEIPPHLAPYFIPKLVRDGSTVRLGQVRFDETTKKFCWQVFAQPLRAPTATTIRPQLRISCPNMDKKFTMEDIIHFTRHYNIRSDGSFYKATPEKLGVSNGYGEYGTLAPTMSGKTYFSTDYLI